jgi:hypothetical protein
MGESLEIAGCRTEPISRRGFRFPYGQHPVSGENRGFFERGVYYSGYYRALLQAVRRSFDAISRSLVYVSRYDDCFS